MMKYGIKKYASVNNYIGLNNKLFDFLQARLDKFVNINTYLNNHVKQLDKRSGQKKSKNTGLN